jgi:hypothetical protein
MMSQQEYNEWWIGQPEDPAELGEPTSTLVEHVMALQQRIDDLPEDLNCACAYDHPNDVCMVHKNREAT